MALKLDVLANTRQVVSEMKKAGASVEDVTDALDDMAREGGQDGEKLERSFRELAQASRAAGRQVGNDLDDGFDKAKRGADDFKDEANSSLRETAASITSVEDALGAVQEIAANAFVGFGPVGAGAGLVAALGFGLLLENLRAQGEAADEMKRRWSDAYAAAAEAGRDFLDQQQIEDEARDIRFNPDRVNEYNQAVKDAAALNLAVNDVLLARAGDEESLQLVVDETNRKYKQVFSDFARARSAEAAELVQIEDRYRALADLQAENAQKARDDQAVRDQLHEQERDQISRTHEALLGIQQLGPVTVPIVPKVDWREVQELERRMARGLQVNVTALNGGRTWE
jgi:hypothetical protein